MNLTALPAFSDTTLWTIDDNRELNVIDPGKSAPVESALDAQPLALAGILVTRHCDDRVNAGEAPASLAPPRNTSR